MSIQSGDRAVQYSAPSIALSLGQPTSRSVAGSDPPLTPGVAVSGLAGSLPVHAAGPCQTQGASFALGGKIFYIRVHSHTCRGPRRHGG